MIYLCLLISFINISNRLHLKNFFSLTTNVSYLCFIYPNTLELFYCFANWHTFFTLPSINYGFAQTEGKNEWSRRPRWEGKDSYPVILGVPSDLSSVLLTILFRNEICTWDFLIDFEICKISREKKHSSVTSVSRFF